MATHDHQQHDHTEIPHTKTSTAEPSPHEAMGHGSHHAGMSIAEMAVDMRKRFLVAALLSVPILLWSPIGRDVLNFRLSAPFGLRDDLFA
jgi:Cu2+-exporting ATPase